MSKTRGVARVMVAGGYVLLAALVIFQPNQLTDLFSRALLLDALGIDSRLHFSVGLLICLILAEAFRSIGKPTKLEYRLYGVPRQDRVRFVVKEVSVPLLIILLSNDCFENPLRSGSCTRGMESCGGGCSSTDF